MPKRIYCEIHMFDLHQRVYEVDPETGEKQCIAITTLEELPITIAAASKEKNLHKIYLSGNSILSKAVQENIITYAKTKYDYENLEIEVLN